MEALHNLGIDGKLLLAQAVNFLVLLFILKRFAYRPMLRFLEKRTARIEKGLKDAEEAKRTLAAMESKEREVLKAAREEGKAILSRASEAAEKRGKTIVAEMEAKAESLLADARKSIAVERERMLRETKGEIVETVLISVRKVLKEKVDGEKDRELVGRFLENEPDVAGRKPNV